MHPFNIFFQAMQADIKDLSSFAIAVYNGAVFCSSSVFTLMRYFLDLSPSGSHVVSKVYLYVLM